MTLLLLACAAVMLASLSGKLLLWRSAGVLIERNLHFLVSFATGVFIIFAWQLSVEVFEHMELLHGLLWVLTGAVGVTLVCRWLPHGHKAQETEHHHNHTRLDAHRMLVSDSIHNAGDGILLAASYAAGPAFGLVATASVFLHEVLQEIAEFFVLRDAGYSTRRALIINFFTSSAILLGAIGGFVVIELFEALEGPLLAIATGGVLSVVFFDLLPHTLRDSKTRPLLFRHIVWLALGAILMYGIVTLVPHQDPAQIEIFL